MTYSVYQHWDPLKVCVVGRSYPPEFYSWITIPHVRDLFEKIAIETEEDYQAIIKKLELFGVKILRPSVPSTPFVNGKFVPPPMTPRDYTAMVGERFYEGYTKYAFNTANYHIVKDPQWPECSTWKEFNQLPAWIKEECKYQHGFYQHYTDCTEYNDIFDHIRAQGNQIINNSGINSAMLARVGKDLYFGTESYDQSIDILRKEINLEFPDYRTHIINTGGHSDGTYCPVCPGLIISLYDVPSYYDTFPDWEVVYLPGQSWSAVRPFLELKKQNRGKWWIPGFENDQDVVDTVETWLGHWTGYVEETVFDVNMLIVDPKNVMVSNYNKQVFDALDRYGITPHIVPFRHRYFWDGGIHCITSDLHREGTMQDYFTNRKDQTIT
jgi:glycine amidinotransferase